MIDDDDDDGDWHEFISESPEKAAAAIEQLEGQVKRLREELSEANAEIARYAAQVEDLDARLDHCGEKDLEAAESENERLVSEKQALIDCREQDDAEFRETLSKLNEARAENERLKEALEGAKNRLSRGQPDRSEQSREALLILSLALKENSNAVL